MPSPRCRPASSSGVRLCLPCHACQSGQVTLHHPESFEMTSHDVHGPWRVGNLVALFALFAFHACSIVPDCPSILYDQSQVPLSLLLPAFVSAPPCSSQGSYGTEVPPLLSGPIAAKTPTYLTLLVSCCFCTSAAQLSWIISLPGGNSYWKRDRKEITKNS